jgi:hypothetical protein
MRHFVDVFLSLRLFGDPEESQHDLFYAPLDYWWSVIHIKDSCVGKIIYKDREMGYMEAGEHYY